MALAISHRSHNGAQRTAGTWNHDEVTGGSDGPFAVNPTRFLVGDAVVAAVPEKSGLRPERRREAPRDEFTICLGPADREVVAAEILLPRERIRFDCVAEMLIHMSSQDGFAQPA